MKRTLLILIPLIAFSNAQPVIPSVDLSKYAWLKDVSTNFSETMSNVGAAMADMATGSSQIASSTTNVIAKLIHYAPRTSAISVASLVGLGIYAKYCRSSLGSKWKNCVENAKNQYTEFLSTTPTDQNGKDTDDLMFWNNNLEGFQRPADILLNKDTVIRALITTQKISGETEKNTVLRLLEKIRQEKHKLKAIRNSLETCLKESRLSPTFTDSKPWIKGFIDKQIVDVCSKNDIKYLSKEDEQNITKAIEREQTLLNPYNLLRKIAFPLEISANEQYWKICLLLSRLDVLHDILREKLATL